MARGVKLDIEFGSWGDGWEADNKKRAESTTCQTLPPEKHFLVFKKEKRRGKPVTLAGEFFLDKEEEKALLKRIKKRLGSGGTFKNGWMELQGEKTAQLREILIEEGFRLKK